MQPKHLAHLRVPLSPTLTPDGALAAVAVTRIDLDVDDCRSAIGPGSLTLESSTTKSGTGAAWPQRLW